MNLNTLLDLFGFPEKVYSSTNRRGEFDISAEDSSSILMKYKNFCITVNLCFMQKMQERNFTIIGTDGYIKLDLVNQSIHYKTLNNKEIILEDIWSNDDFFKKQLLYYLNEFPLNSKLFTIRLLNLTRLFDELIE